MLWFLLIGLCAGWLSGELTKGKSFGLIGNLIIGATGAVVGGLLFKLLGAFLADLLMATVGAVALLAALRHLPKLR